MSSVSNLRLDSRKHPERVPQCLVSFLAQHPGIQPTEAVIDRVEPRLVVHEREALRSLLHAEAFAPVVVASHAPTRSGWRIVSRCSKRESQTVCETSAASAGDLPMLRAIDHTIGPKRVTSVSQELRSPLAARRTNRPTSSGPGPATGAVEDITIVRHSAFAAET